MMDTLPSAMLLMFSMGFMGSLHCIGMCGGLVSAVSMSQKQVWWSGLLVYQFGRVTTYAVLGLLVGVSGAALSSYGGDILQRSLTILAGMMMLIFAMNLAGWLPDPLRRVAVWASWRIGLAQLARYVANDPRTGGWYVLGLANGLLPCGLVYAALSLALAAGDGMNAVMMMMGFGMGTIPAMLAVPALLQRMSPALRSIAMRSAAGMIFILGLMTVFRSTMYMHQM